MIAVEVGIALALAAGALWLVLFPLFSGAVPVPDVYEEPDPTETRKGQAIAALKEIEFDRVTGKLSDADYGQLYSRYSAEAIRAMREEDRSAASPIAAPAPASGDAIEAMVAAELRTMNATAEAPAASAECPVCGPRPETDAVFCSECGQLLPNPGACAVCGATLEPGGRYCGSCGTQAVG